MLQKVWYVLYTRANCEKKVSFLLSKKKIENFCPMIETKILFLKRVKIHSEPLFKSYVFVRLSEEDISYAKQTAGVINFLYWQEKPAVIQNEEILTIQEFTNDYKEIELIKTTVNMHDVPRVIEGPSYSIDGKLLALKNRSIKIELPTLGYIMVANLKEENIFGKQITILQENSFSQ
jgi:transcriptional antiterminator NusG